MKGADEGGLKQERKLHHHRLRLFRHSGKVFRCKRGEFHQHKSYRRRDCVLRVF